MVLIKPGKRVSDLEEFILRYTLKDRVLLGWIAGALGVITRDAWSFLAKTLGLAKFQVWEISASLFIAGKEAHTFFAHIIGITADLIFGGILGIGFIYFIKYTSSKNMIIKGWGVGMTAWLFLFGIMFHNLPSVEMIPHDALSNLSAFIGHSIFGISMGIFAKVLLKKYDLLLIGRR